MQEIVEGEQPSPGRYGPGGRLLLSLARIPAIAGGLIVGRKLFAWTVPGDVELLQMCAAFAAASFFAYCHLIGGDVKVDFFTHNLGPWLIALLDAIGSLLVGSFGALIAWRTAAGALSV